MRPVTLDNWIRAEISVYFIRAVFQNQFTKGDRQMTSTNTKLEFNMMVLALVVTLLNCLR